jgi:antitoxin component YwqK of YwqJK toxin-antitoxin module
MRKFEIKKDYHPNGKIWYETPYVNGLRHGIEKTYRYSGKIWYETSYINGRKQGVHKSYYSTGDLSRISFYKNFQKHSIHFELDRFIKYSTVVYSTPFGKLFYILNLKHRMKHGIQIDFI